MAIYHARSSEVSLGPYKTVKNIERLFQAAVMKDA